MKDKEEGRTSSGKQRDLKSLLLSDHDAWPWLWLNPGMTTRRSAARHDRRQSTTPQHIDEFQQNDWQKGNRG